MIFPVSGVQTPFWVPIIVAFGVSTLTSMGGISGAFLLLPFQVSILGFASPAVTPTNMIYNIVAIPSGVYRYAKENRMIWPLLWGLMAGTSIGILLGVVIRIRYLPDPRNFKAFVGLVLAYMAYRLIKDILKKDNSKPSVDSGKFVVGIKEFRPQRISFEFSGRLYTITLMPVFILSVIVGAISGIYGIGGGALIAPALVVMFGLPVHAIAGITLLNTFLTSIIGVLLYVFLAPFYARGGTAVSPDWLLGILFGIGGFAGMYLGSRLQKYVRGLYIKIILAIAIAYISINYIIGFFG